MRLALLLVLFITPCCLAQPEPKTYGGTAVSVRAVYDGDTFRVDIAGWPAIVGDNMPIRIRGIDTPEMHAPNKRVADLAKTARQLVLLKLRGAKTVELRMMERDKYFRIVADVYADGESIGQLLLDAKLAKPYDGKTKAKWSNADVDAYDATQ